MVPLAKLTATPKKHYLVASALVISVLVHWWFLGGLQLNLWETQDKTLSVTTFDITLDSTVPAPDLAAPPTIPEIPDDSPAPADSNPVTPETTAPPETVLANTEEPVATTPANIEPSQTSPNIDSTVLRRQVLASIRQPGETPNQTTSELPSNWTQDALPLAGVEQPALLEPLTYTGPATVERWQSADGTPETRTVLADGTVLCARGHTLLPNSNFEATVMQTRLCGKEKGGRENKNRLARYHPGYVEPQPSRDPEPQSEQ